eukprot:955092-Prorocentrum_lima.AAC.1
MTSSLVGSEMCIRDRLNRIKAPDAWHKSRSVSIPVGELAGQIALHQIPVSYTHLTLPTICSV